jgi:hypothetical protein
MTRNATLFLPLLLTCGMVLAQQPLRDEAQGAWRGKATQTGAAPYTVEMVVEQDGTGKLVGRTSYPELACTGRLALVAESTMDLRFRETIDPPTPRCVTAGHVYLVRSRPGQLRWGWAPPQGPLAANAELSRVETQSAAPALKPQRPQSAATGPERSPGSSNPTASRLSPAEATQAVRILDGAFQQWSRLWSIDRYVSGSLRLSESATREAEHLLRGTFTFLRLGGANTIPFSSVFRRVDGNLLLTSLCYNDITSGTTDCLGQQDPTTGPRQLMGAIVALGLLAALTSERPGTTYEYCEWVWKDVPMGGYESYECDR